MIDLTHDARMEGLASAKDCLDLPKLCGVVEKAAKDLRLTLPVEPARFSLAQLEERGGFDNAVVGLIRELDTLTALLETQAQTLGRARKLLAARRRTRRSAAALAEGGPTRTTCAGVKPTRCPYS